MKLPHLSFGLVCLSLIVFLSFQAAAQKTPAKNTPPQADKAEKQQELLARLERVRSLVERAKTMSNVYFRVEALVGLAETIWRHDPNYAEEIFVETYQSLGASQPLRSRSGFGGRKTVLNLSPEARLRAAIRAALLRLSPASVGKLGKILETEELQLSGIEATRALVEAKGDESQIKQYWAESLKNGVSSESTYALNYFGGQNRQIADQLFLQTLASLSGNSEISGDLLNELGSYVFAFDGQTREAGMTMGVVGKVMIVVLREPRVEASPQTVRGFLQFAANVLARPIADAREKEIYYVTAYQLLPHFRRFAPEFEPATAGAMQRLLAEIPEIYANPATYKPLDANVGRSEHYASAEYEKTIGEMRDDERKDFYILQAAARLYQSGNFARARFYADQIKDVFLAERIKNLLDYGEAVGFLKENEIAAAAKRAEKMSKNLETAVLWLEIADRQIKAKNSIAARESLLNVERTLRDAADADAVLVRLRAAELFARINDYAAFPHLSEAVKIYNRLPVKDTMSFGWRVKFETEYAKKQGRIAPFYFALAGAEKPTMAKSFEPLLKMDKFAVESAVVDLKNEPALSGALVALAKFYLNSTGENPRKTKPKTSQTEDN